MNTFVEFNCLCAEYMGLKLGWWIPQSKPLTDDKKQWVSPDATAFTGNVVYETHQLMFHEDWNWIIEVVKKLVNQLPPTSDIRQDLIQKVGRGNKKATIYSIWECLIELKKNKK